MNALNLNGIKKCVHLQQGDKVNVISVSDKGEKKIQKARIIKTYNTFILIKYISSGILESFLFIDIYINKNLRKAQAFMRQPCKNCTDRVLGCHGVCKEYMEFKEENERIRKRIIEEHRKFKIKK